MVQAEPLTPNLDSLGCLIRVPSEEANVDLEVLFVTPPGHGPFPLVVAGAEYDQVEVLLKC